MTDFESSVFTFVFDASDDPQNPKANVLIQIDEESKEPEALDDYITRNSDVFNPVAIAYACELGVLALNNFVADANALGQYTLPLRRKILNTGNNKYTIGKLETRLNSIINSMRGVHRDKYGEIMDVLLNSTAIRDSVPSSDEDDLRRAVVDQKTVAYDVLVLSEIVVAAIEGFFVNALEGSPLDPLIRRYTEVDEIPEDFRTNAASNQRLYTRFLVGLLTEDQFNNQGAPSVASSSPSVASTASTLVYQAQPNPNAQAQAMQQDQINLAARTNEELRKIGKAVTERPGFNLDQLISQDQIRNMSVTQLKNTTLASLTLDEIRKIKYAEKSYGDLSKAELYAVLQPIDPASVDYGAARGIQGVDKAPATIEARLRSKRLNYQRASNTVTRALVNRVKKQTSKQTRSHNYLTRQPAQRLRSSDMGTRNVPTSVDFNRLRGPYNMADRDDGYVMGVTEHLVKNARRFNEML